MKKILLLLVVMSMAVLGRAQQFSKAELHATGLTCAMCSNAINKALQALPYISSVKSNIKNSSFNIVFKENAAVDIDGIRKAVEDAGFSIGKLFLTGNFQEVAVANDKHVKIGNQTFHFLNVSDQVLNGEATISMVDKGFLSSKQFKKFSSATKMSCVNTGKAESCCTNEGTAAGARVFHVTI